MKVLKLLILLPLVLLLTACPEDDPIKPDPCEGKKPVSAEFKIKQRIIDVMDSMQEINIETDTVLTYREITFEADGDFDNYKWQLGDDPNIKSGKKITYNFTKVWGKLQMRLIVKGKRDNLCFPDDDGIDTIIKPVL